MENKIPNPTGDPVTLFDSARAVMIQMIPAQMPQVGIARLSEMEVVVGPLFADVALHHTGKQSRRRIDREQEADRRGDEEERQDVLQFATDVPAVEGPLMMLPMKRIEPLVEKAANQAFAGRETAVQDITMKEVFH